MVAKRPHDDLRRKKHTREPRKRFVVFCEGRNTEPHYFEALRRACGHTLVNVKTIPAGCALPCAEAAVTFVRKGRKGRDSFEAGDEVWAVFDHDDDPGFDEAVTLCKSKNVGAGWSNPCFEVWLILHQEDFNRDCDAKAAQKHLEKIHPEYDASREKVPDNPRLIQKVAEAEDRAETLLRRREEENAPFGRPSTAVHKLTRAIREAARKARPNPTARPASTE